jgi:CheY-like chemotaxis protein
MERRPTVLLADDDDATRDAVASLLQDEGYDVLFAADGFGVLDLLGRETPDFMLVDLRMPGLGGRDLIRALDSSERPPPLIAMTASGPEANDAEIAHPILRKPFSADALLAAIASVCPPSFEATPPSTDRSPIGAAVREASDTSKQTCGSCTSKAAARCGGCGEAFCAKCHAIHERGCEAKTLPE